MNIIPIPHTKKLQPQNWMIAPETQKLMQALNVVGDEARFVGGCVRNALVNRPVLDIDIATTLPPDEVIARLHKNNLKHAPTGLKHGTVTAIVDGRSFEVTTLRLDVMTFGRHAEVKYTDDWKTDASRRDFTINAIYCDAEGNLFDPFNGVEDLRLGIVRFVGDAPRRIHEDVLRILRYFRFYAHFGRGLPDATAVRACRDAAKQVTNLSAERIRTEVFKLLDAEHCLTAWKLMMDCNVVTQFLPEASNVQALENLLALEEQYDVQTYALRRLAALLDVTPSGLTHIISSLKLSNDQALQLTRFNKPLLGPLFETMIEVDLNITPANLRRVIYKFGNELPRNLLLLAAARRGDAGDLQNLYSIATEFHPTFFPLQGDDVLALGYRAGPDIGRILAIMEEWWAVQDFKPNRDECLALLQTQFKKQ